MNIFKKYSFRSIIIFFVFEHLWRISALGQTVTLGKLNVDRDFVTLSGFSSGATFAQQLFISHSSLFSGLAVFSHSYYRCGGDISSLEDYNLQCTKVGNHSDLSLYDPEKAVGDIHKYYRDGYIDNPSYMENKPLYVYAGTRNELFSTDMSFRILQVFDPFIRNAEAIFTRVQDASLLLPTVNYGLPCSLPSLNNYYLGSCGISGAFEALQHLLGSDNVKKPGNSKSLPMQALLTFDQTKFFSEIDVNSGHGLDSLGFLYIPSNCKNGVNECFLHFYFHGCLVGREFVGDKHIIHSGYLEVAEFNHIIMVFPQAIRGPGNDLGCWDTLGFSGQFYATKYGTQIRTIQNMLSTIAAEDFHDLNNLPSPDFEVISPHLQMPLNSLEQVVSSLSSFPSASNAHYNIIPPLLPFRVSNVSIRTRSSYINQNFIHK